MLSGQGNIQHVYRHIELPGRLIHPLDWPTKQPFGLVENVIQAEASAAANIEYALRAGMVHGAHERTNRVLDVDIVAHHTAVAPNLDRLALHGLMQKNRNHALGGDMALALAEGVG